MIKHLDKITSTILNKIKLNFIAEDNEKELMSKRLIKYIYIFFYYFDKYLIVLSATSGIISIDSFATVIGASV